MKLFAGAVLLAHRHLPAGAPFVVMPPETEIGVVRFRIPFAIFLPQRLEGSVAIGGQLAMEFGKIGKRTGTRCGLQFRLSAES